MKPEGAMLEATKGYGWFKEARQYLSTPLREAQKDCDYYDNEQWTKEELAELEERKQPPVIKNEIKAAIDLVLGTETKVRVDFKAAPRTGAHVQDADIVTHLMKHAMDQCGGEYVFSEAFEAAMKPGWGWVEVYKERDPFKEPTAIRFLDRKHVFYDPYAKLWDLSDAKYMGRMKWLDLDEAKALYPEHEKELQRAIDGEEFDHIRQPYEITGDEVDPHGSIFDWEATGITRLDWIDVSRKRVRIIEIWYKVPSKIMILENLATGEKEEWEPEAPGAIEKLMDPNSQVKPATIKKVRKAMIAGPNVLEDDWSPYRHNHYPFVPFWSFKKDKDRTPYGMVRQMRSPQDEINKRASKALHILSTAQVIADKKSVGDNVDEIRREAARPDGVLIKRNPDGLLEINRDTELAKAQFMMMQEAKESINRISGISPDMKGEPSNAKSGKAILARQQQGNMMLARPFDLYRRARQRVGELLFANIQQFTTTPKIVRVVDEVGNFDFVTINERYTEPASGRAYIRNDVTRARVDVKIDEMAFHASIREAMLEQMMEMATKLPPEISLALLDLVVAYSDLPGRDEMVKRIQQIQQMIMGQGLQSGAQASVAAEA